MAVKRMLLGVAPRLLRDLLLESLTQCTELKVEGEVVDEVSLLTFLDRLVPDAILITLPQPVPRAKLEPLFARHADCVWWLLAADTLEVERVADDQRQQFGPLSIQQLVAAMINDKRMAGPDNG